MQVRCSKTKTGSPDILRRSGHIQNNYSITILISDGSTELTHASLPPDTAALSHLVSIVAVVTPLQFTVSTISFAVIPLKTLYFPHITTFMAFLYDVEAESPSPSPSHFIAEG